MSKKWRATDYNKIEKAIEYIQNNFKKQPTLKEISKAVHLSEFHFQRLFKKWTGVSPKNILQYLTLHNAKEKLRENLDVLSATIDSGLTSPSRLHDLFIKIEAMTPGEYKLKGKDLEIRYGAADCPFGYAFIGVTSRGICHLSFTSDKNTRKNLAEIKEKWPNAHFIKDTRLAQKYIYEIFSESAQHANKKKEIPVLLSGSKFQLKVWEALLNIPEGELYSYKNIADVISNPNGARAVGNALGQNSVGYLIPCHRVIQSTGIVGPFRWGSARKQAMLAFEELKTVKNKHS